MPLHIEDYGLIGDCETAGLVGRDGSIDWLCFPRFDSPACFAALLGKPEDGRWLIAPDVEVRSVRRNYRDGSLILETEFETADGAVRLIDCTPLRDGAPDVVRIVEGLRGQVAMKMELVIRFDYGSIVPWVRASDGGLTAIAGPEMLRLTTPVETYGKDFRTCAEFKVSAGQRVPFVLTWHNSYSEPPPQTDPEKSLAETESYWREWSEKCDYQGRWRPQVLRSLITLKALTYAPTGGVVAAATTSLPEQLGGVRNWDYRYCWLRDSTFTLYALMNGGYREEAQAWREWLLRAVAGMPSQLQIMYGLAGERRLTEFEIPWLSGYEGAKPVRVGNAASKQLQLDVFGEVMDSLYLGRRIGLPPNENAWHVEQLLVEYLQTIWQQPDEGIWEVRGPRQHFTHSKVMAWVAVDRAVKTIERFHEQGPLEDWRRLRDEIHNQVCREGFDPKLNSFVQHYGAQHLDASLLMIPLVGFLPCTDPRVIGTVRAIEQQLLVDDFVLRYPTETGVDGLPPGEGAFLACTFWLADNYAQQGRDADAERIFERLCALSNDVGLLSEEYDPVAKRMVGNFPQAFSHVGLINTARNISHAGGPCHHRGNHHGGG